MMRRSVRAAAILISAAAAAAAAPIHSEASHTTRVETAGRCDLEIATYVPIEAQRARQAVNDPRFTIDEVGGVAKLLVFIELCDSSADGGAASASTLGGIGVVTDPARSVGDCGAYDFFWPNSVENDWYRAMNDLGFRAPHVPGAKLDVSHPAGVVTEAGGTVPFSEAPWLMSMSTVEPSFPELPLVSVHCHTGPRGVVRGTFDHRFTTATAGLGEVTLGDTPFWQQLGIAGRTMTLPVAAFRFTWTGLVEILTDADDSDDADAFATRGSCIQAGLAIPVEAADLRPYVPGRFPLLLDASGKAGIFVYTVDCDEYIFGEGPPSEAVLTGVLAAVGPPDGSPGVEAYDILMTTDHVAAYQALTGLGLFQGLVDATLEVGSVAGPVVSVAAETPWSYSPYEYDTTSAAPPAAGITLPTVHWQLGSRGLVRSVFTHTNLVVTPGAGEVRAQAGSPLARILGATTVKAAGGLLRFSFSGVTEIVEPDPPAAPKRGGGAARPPVLAVTGVDGRTPVVAGATVLASAAGLTLRRRRAV